LILIVIPLVLSAFTHIFNWTGFPCVDYDEAIYLRRALYILEGSGPQDPASRFDHGQGTTSSYDHPHFGQIFLAGILGVVGYPDSLQMSTTTQSIEMLYAVPRILMGVLSVVDTFLVYLIANRYYKNRYVAVGSSILFAVMPLTWMTRRIYLDSILLPFLLSSILLGVHYNTRDKTQKQNGNKNRILILLSGICLGIAIYTKVPAIAMIPLIGSLVFLGNGPDRSVGIWKNVKNRFGKKNLKILGIWFIPVVAIPLLWPAYAISIGQFDEWMQGVFWQGRGRLLFERTGELDTSSHTVQSELGRIYHMDPVLVVVGISGIIFAAVRKDYLILLWVVPFFILVILIHWVYYFHFIILLPAFCIASASLIVLGPDRIIRKKRTATFLSVGTITGIGFFGIVTTMILIGSNFSLSQFAITSFVAEYMNNNEPSGNDDTTIISSPESAWIFKYIFGKENALPPRDSEHMLTEEVLLVADENYLYVVNQLEVEDEKQVQKIQDIYNNSVILAIFEPAFDESAFEYPLKYNINSCTVGLGEVRIIVR
jgi:4-amino-4-deoxy-L-arabinose transferase-like glycosyltransferase